MIFLCHSEAHLWAEESSGFMLSWILHCVQNDGMCITCHSKERRDEESRKLIVLSWIHRCALDDGFVLCVIQRLIYEPKNPDAYSDSLKSFHKGLFSSIIANFFFLLTHFKCFSHSIASSIVGNSWYRTKSWIWYFLVNQSINSDLCSNILFSKFEVTQTYRVQFFCDARI